MLKSVRMVPKTGSDKGQIITFVLAIGAARQVCQLETDHGEIEDDVIQLTML